MSAVAAAARHPSNGVTRNRPGVIGWCRTSARNVVYFDPAPAQVASGLGRNVNHMRMPLGGGGVRRVFSRQFEIHLGGFVRENVLIGERRLDLAVHKKHD